MWRRLTGSREGGSCFLVAGGRAGVLAGWLALVIFLLGFACARWLDRLGAWMWLGAHHLAYKSLGRGDLVCDLDGYISSFARIKKDVIDLLVQRPCLGGWGGPWTGRHALPPRPLVILTSPPLTKEDRVLRIGCTTSGMPIYPGLALLICFSLRSACWWFLPPMLTNTSLHLWHALSFQLISSS